MLHSHFAFLSEALRGTTFFIFLPEDFLVIAYSGTVRVPPSACQLPAAPTNIIGIHTGATLILCLLQYHNESSVSLHRINTERCIYVGINVSVAKYIHTN